MPHRTEAVVPPFFFVFASIVLPLSFPFYDCLFGPSIRVWGQRKLGVCIYRAYFAPKCTHYKTKGVLRNDSRELYQFLSHFT